MKKYYNLKDSYKLYKKVDPNPVDVKVFLSIGYGFMKFLTRKLLTKGEIFLPERLGKLQVVGKKVKVRIEDGEIKGLAPDWKSTLELWERNPDAKEQKKLVYHFNEATNGIRYRFGWCKNRVLMPNKTLYSLKMTRTNKRYLSSLIKQGKEYAIQ